MALLNKIKDKLRINYRKKRWPGLINAYKQYLPVTKKTPIISLNEGNTPLIFSYSISQLIGNGTKVFLKYDGLNPTGSFKDRGMTMAISKAKEEGREAIICASTNYCLTSLFLCFANGHSHATIFKRPCRIKTVIF